MAKRPAADTDVYQTAAKRIKTSSDRLSHLSDELLLRIFHCLSAQELNICQRVSQHFQKITTDSQLWKAAYYERFIRPRLLRLPGRRCSAVDSSTLSHSSRLSKWLDDGWLVRKGRHVDWKKQYKVRHNWSRGVCDVTQIPVANRPARPPILARLHNGIVFTVDSEDGLRAWSYKDEKKLLASKALDTLKGNKHVPLPTSLDLDFHDQFPDLQWIVLGQKDGAFSIYCYSRTTREFRHCYTHPASSNGTIAAVAMCSPYVLCMTDSQLLSLYRFDAWTSGTPNLIKPPTLLASLRSHTAWPPVSLSMRKAGQKIVASIAISVPSYLSGWSVGIQELQLDYKGDILSSRTASALANGFEPLKSNSPEPNQSPNQLRVGHENRVFSRPTSLSYSHPYILVSSSDNTLTLYMATSTAADLTISAGRQLFGHTSSVFSAHVEGRGKAVSVGVQENDIRVWELEGATFPIPSRSRLSCEDVGIRVNPERRMSDTRRAIFSETINRSSLAVGSAAEAKFQNRQFTRGWVGFDEENLIILREQTHGAQALAIYDFS